MKKLNKIKALLIKDIRNNLRNSNTIIFTLLPILFTELYHKFSFGGKKMDSFYVFTIGLLMSVCTMPISSMAISISEEKEKNTLRTLMLANVSPIEFLFSKTFIIFCLTQFVGTIVYLLTGATIDYSWYFLTSSITNISLICLGAVIGILSKNQMSTSILSMPLILILLIPTALGNLNDSIGMFARYLPTNAMLELLKKQNMKFNCATISTWLLISICLFIYSYRKRMVD